MNKEKLMALLNLSLLDESSTSSSESESEIEVLKKKKIVRRFWVHPYFQERNSGAFSNVFGSIEKIGDPYFFVGYTRMTTSQFEELFEIVGPLIEKQTLIRVPIPSKMRLVIALRFLATGESQKSLSFAYKCSPQSIHNIIVETTDAIIFVLKTKVFPKLDEEKYKSVAKGFQDQWNFPHCIGAIDGKHVVIKAPPKSGSEFYNYKKTSSIVLMAICDANYSFLMCDVGAAGRQSDGGVFRNSEFGQKFYSNSLSIPPPGNVADDLQNAPYVFVADDAFSLTINMLKPYSKRGLSVEERIFNYRLSRARRVIENSFGILGSKWRIYGSAINADLSLTEKIVGATVCLHNWLRGHQGNSYIESKLVDSESAPGLWRSENNNFLPLESGNYNSSTLAKETRVKFTKYFSGSGAVSWQNAKI